MIQVPAASGTMNFGGGGGGGESVNVAVAADTAGVAQARTIDFTLEGKEGLFQVRCPTIHHPASRLARMLLLQWLCGHSTLVRSNTHTWCFVAMVSQCIDVIVTRLKR